MSTPIRPSGSLSHLKKFLIMHAPVTRFVLAPATNTLDYSIVLESTYSILDKVSAFATSEAVLGITIKCSSTHPDITYNRNVLLLYNGSRNVG